MKQSFAQVEDLLNLVGPFFIMSGVSKNRCKMPTGDINSIEAQKYIDAFDWLSEVLESEEYAKVLKAWNLRTPEQWKDYEIYGFTGMQEQIILRNALNDFRILWKNKPSSFFGRHINEEEEENHEDAGDENNQQHEIQS